MRLILRELLAIYVLLCEYLKLEHYTNDQRVITSLHTNKDMIRLLMYVLNFFNCVWH